MKNITRHIGKLTILKRLKNSYEGNPKYLCGVVDKNQNGFTFVTPTNSMYGYSIPNYSDKQTIVEIGSFRNIATLHSIKEV